MERHPGTQGYVERAAELGPRYARLSFDVVHAPILDLLPDPSVPALDVGAGAGQNAAWLAARGHPVTAVEPVVGLRAGLPPAPGVTWLGDALPDLAELRAGSPRFGLVLLAAVWMHLDRSERARGFPRLAELTTHGGLLLMTLRHGPVPAGRRMFPVSAEETIAAAAEVGFALLRSIETDSIEEPNRRAGVRWSHLAFRRG